MLTKNKIQLIQSLHQKKFRQQHQLFIAEGEKVVEGLLNSNFQIETIIALKDWAEENKKLLRKHIDKLEIADSKTLERISSLTTPNAVIAVAEMQKHGIQISKLQKQLILILDNINDPGNLGTILRIADWYGISTIICSETTVDLYNPKIGRAHV